MNVRPTPQKGPSFSERLREVIRASGMTGHEIAARAGVSHTVLSRFLSGARSMSLDTFDRIAPVLRVKLVAGNPKSSKN